MKYREKSFIRHQERQKSGEFDVYASYERRVRRQKIERHKQFYQLHLSKYVDKYWWKNLNIDERDEISRLYLFAVEESSFSLEKFLCDIKKSFKPNMSELRKDKLRLLGI